MAEAVPSVALLFDDAGLGEPLRSALLERGAKIVHEGPLIGLTRELLSSVDADVLVVNLDDDNDEALDRLDDALEGDRPRVVFNDGQASRRLEGWDRARWARHLAMKVLAIGDADPPRPPAPPEVSIDAPSPAVTVEEQLAAAAAEVAPKIGEEARQAAVSETLAAELEALLAADAPAGTPAPAVMLAADTATGDVTGQVAEHVEVEHSTSASSDISAELDALLNGGELSPLNDFSATVPGSANADHSSPASLALDTASDAGLSVTSELEALLSSGLPLEEVNEFGSGLNYAAGEHAELHDGMFGREPFATVEAVGERAGVAPDAEPLTIEDVAEMQSMAAVESPAEVSFQIDHLTLAPVEETANSPVARTEAAPIPTPRVSDGWTLYDHDAPAATATAERPDPADFGIQKLSAADYLAPDAGDADASPILPGLSLELVSLEEAIAPQNFEPSHEMVLDVPASMLPHLVVLGATTESTASVGEFLAALPSGLRATVLHTQHLAGRPADGLVDYFASQCALPVRQAEPGMRACLGEVIVVPSDRQVAVRRDGTMELKPIEPGSVHAPSIDASFTHAASAFGRDVIAIVFAGRSTDAVGGCQAVFDRGGKVWVEATSGTQAADMVSGVLAEHLSHQAGTPRELAARLAEQFSEGQP